MQHFKWLGSGRLKVAVQRAGLLTLTTGLSLLLTPVVVSTVASSLLFFLQLAATFSRGDCGRETKTKVYGELTHEQ